MSTKRSGKPPLVADKRYTSKARAPKKRRKPATTRRKKTSRVPGLGLITRFLHWIWRIVFGIGWRLTFVVALLIGSGVLYFYATLPPAAEMLDGRARGSVTMLDRNGDVYAWRGDQFGGVVTARSVSKHLKNAVVATEDKRFYRHLGVSPRGVASAVRINLREGRGPLSGHGGSTITQQTAKLLCLGDPYVPTEWKNEAEYEADCRKGTLWRKIKEATYALAMEAKYSKDEILTIYLNRAFLGAGSRGFEAASQRYFGKSAAEVAPSEAAMLAGLLIAPSRFAPTNNLERAQNRANVIIGLMEEQGYLSASAAAFARQNPAQLSEAAEARTGGYFADWVMQSGPEFFTRNTTEDVIIRTTLDQRIQRAAEEALAEVFTTMVSEGSRAEAAIVVMSADGAVRAMVGGRQTKVSGAFNRATQASRQTGSAFKPFVFATALELGYGYNDLVEDTPLTINVPGSGPWSPKNYSNRFKGTVTLTTALAESLNIPAVRISEDVGRDLVKQVAEDFGIKSDLAVGPALALGTSESTLVEMTGAYAGILNGGSSVTPYGLVSLRLQGDSTDLMDNPGGIGERVIREDAARQLTYMMRKVITEGTGQRAQMTGREVAGKTGTTQAARDAWFIGFTADYVAGVWMGYDDNTPLTGVTGGGLPAEIWRQTMERVHQGVEPKPLPMIRPASDAARQPQVQNTRSNPRRQGRRPATVEDVILDVLNGLLGGNR